MVHLGALARGALSGPRRPSRSASAQGSTSRMEAARRRPTVPRALRAPPSRALRYGRAPAQNPAPDSEERRGAFPKPNHARSHRSLSAPPGPSAPPAHDKAPARPGPDATRAASTTEDDQPVYHRRLPPTIPPLTPLTLSGSLAPRAALRRVRTARRLERAAAARRIRVRGHRK